MKIQLTTSRSIKGCIQEPGTVIEIGFDPNNPLVIGPRCAEWLIERGLATEVSEKKTSTPDKKNEQ